MEIAEAYVVFMSLLTFAVFGADKAKAIRNKWRIPERTLLLLAVLGGSPGALAGMLFFRHKIRKIKFYIGIPAILFMQAGVWCAFIR